MHASVGPIVSGSLKGTMVGAEPMTHVRTLRAGMRPPEQRPGWDKWDVAEAKGKEEAQ